jgi:hypothetical protein
LNGPRISNSQSHASRICAKYVILSLFVSVILQYSIGMSTKKNHSKSVGESFFTHFFGTVFAYHLSPLEGGFSVFPPMGGSTPKTRRWSKNNKPLQIQLASLFTAISIVSWCKYSI